MPWSSVSLIPPQTLADAASGISGFADSVGTALSAVGTVLDVVDVVLTTTADPLAATAQTLVSSTQTALNDFFGGGGYVLVAHPWMAGVGRGDALFRTLEAPRAVRLLAQKLRDTADPHRPNLSSADGLAVIAGAGSPEGFKALIVSMSALFSLKELDFAVRKIEQLFKLDKDRMQRSRSPLQPPWQSWKLSDLEVFGSLQSSLNEGLSLLQNTANASESAIAVLKNVVAQKQAQLAQVQAKLASAQAALASSITANGIYTLNLSGSTSSMAHTLQSEAGLPGAELSVCATVLFVAGTGGLGGLPALFG